MANFFLNLFDKYGLDSLQIGIICYFGWKIMTNHLAHIQSKINEISEKLDSHETSVNKLTERVAKIEGKIE